MKRSYTEESDFTPSPPVESPNNSLSPSPETPKKPKSSPKKAKTSPKGESEQNGSWTGEKRAIFMDRIIEKGYKETDLGALAREIGMSRVQLVNQLAQGRKGSMRDKAVKAVRGD